MALSCLVRQFGSSKTSPWSNLYLQSFRRDNHGVFFIICINKDSWTMFHFMHIWDYLEIVQFNTYVIYECTLLLSMKTIVTCWTAKNFKFDSTYACKKNNITPTPNRPYVSSEVWSDLCRETMGNQKFKSLVCDRLACRRVHKRRCFQKSTSYEWAGFR